MEELPGGDGHNVGGQLREMAETAPLPSPFPRGSLLLTSYYGGFQTYTKVERIV